MIIVSLRKPPDVKVYVQIDPQVANSLFTCTQEECDAKSKFKRISAGLNAEFSFSLTGYQTKAKETRNWSWGKEEAFESFTIVILLYELKTAFPRFYLFQNLLAIIFKWSTFSLNSEFFLRLHGLPYQGFMPKYYLLFIHRYEFRRE